MEENIYFESSVIGDELVMKFTSNASKIDAKNYKDIQEFAEREIKKAEVSAVSFDLSNVVYVSSAGLRMFSAVNSIACENDFDYRVFNLLPEITKMFQLTGYSSMFRIETKSEF